MTLEQRAAQHYPDHPAYQQAWLRIIHILGDQLASANPVLQVGVKRLV